MQRTQVIYFLFMVLKYPFLEYKVPVECALFSLKIMSSKRIFLLEIKKDKPKSSNEQI